MVEEKKRYSIVEYLGYTEREVISEEEYNKFVNYIKKLNNRKTSPLYFGNISKQKIKGKIRITIHIYNRLTMPRTISDIDTETSTFRSIKEYIKTKYSSSVKHINPDVYIAYFEKINNKKNPVDVGIMPLPLLFECDQKYFDPSYVKKCLKAHSDEKDVDFFKGIASRFCFNRDCLDEASLLWQACDQVQNHLRLPSDLETISKRLYSNYTYQRDGNRKVVRDEEGKLEYSHRRIRDFGCYIRDYQSNKVLSATAYNVTQDPKNIGKPLNEDQMKLKTSL